MPTLTVILQQSSEFFIVGGRDLLAILPAIVLFFTGTLVLVADLFMGGWTTPVEKSEKRALYFLSLLGTAIAAGAVVGVGVGPSQGIGDFFLGAIHVDKFSHAISLIVLAGTFLAVLGSLDGTERHRIHHGEFYFLTLIAAGSMLLFVQAAGLIMLFVSLETLSLAVFVLTAYNRDSRQAVEGAMKYFVLGGFSSAFLLFGFVLLYAATRETQLTAIAQVVAAGTQVDQPLLIAGMGMTLIGLGFKVGAFPFHSWLPDAYQGAFTPVTAFMAVTVKAAAFAVLVRVGAALTPGADAELLIAGLSALAVLTMIFGNVVAVVQSSVKRMLAYSAIAHTGYLLVGVVADLGLSRGDGQEGQAAVGGTVLFYLVPYLFMTVGSFLVVSYLGRTEDLDSFDSYRGMARRRPQLALCLLLIMVSFVGIPPLAGFWAKFYVFRQALDAGFWKLALVGIITSVVSAYYYLRLVVNMYMESEKDAPELPDDTRTPAGFVIGLAALIVVVMGLYPKLLFDLSAHWALP